MLPVPTSVNVNITMVFLSSEGVRLGVKGVAENIHEEGFQPMADLIWKS